MPLEEHEPQAQKYNQSEIELKVTHFCILESDTRTYFSAS